MAGKMGFRPPYLPHREPNLARHGYLRAGEFGGQVGGAVVAVIESRPVDGLIRRRQVAGLDGVSERMPSVSHGAPDTLAVGE
jgi:hypothetical protein